MAVTTFWDDTWAGGGTERGVAAAARGAAAAAVGGATRAAGVAGAAGATTAPFLPHAALRKISSERL
jgi:hypothetical protein